MPGEKCARLCTLEETLKFSDKLMSLFDVSDTEASF